MARIKSRRKPRHLKNHVYLFVDGEVEIEYLNHIQINKEKNVRFDIRKGNETDFLRGIDDEIPRMIVLDIDATTKSNDPKKRYEKIKKLLTNTKTKDDVFFNNYAFETFLLLHVTNVTKPVYKSSQYDSLMKKHFNITSSWSNNKNSTNVSKVLSLITLENVKDAIKRSKTLPQKRWTLNPSSNMAKFFERLTYYHKVNSE